MSSNVALITGATGQDGAFLAAFPLGKGNEVHGIKRRSSSFDTGRVGHAFGFLECAIGGKSVRTIGIARARTKIGMMNLVYNMRRFLWLRRNGVGAP